VSDLPGFVQVLDDRTLLIPDRAGNNQLDSFTNIITNPDVGLLFLIPGDDETLRVNGTAAITRDPALLARCALNGKLPLSGLAVAVHEAFLHCSKAMLRSRIWQAQLAVGFR